MKINFKEKIPQLSEEHIKQICRFAKTKYVQGEWQKWWAYSSFKCHHQKQQQEQNFRTQLNVL
jgi:hypothetical protein